MDEVRAVERGIERDAREKERHERERVALRDAWEHGVKGGRVIADWPGLKPANLYQGRDLAPTTDLRAVMKGVLKDQFGLAEKVLAGSVFPDSSGAKPMQGLVG